VWRGWLRAALLNAVRLSGRALLQGGHPVGCETGSGAAYHQNYLYLPALPLRALPLLHMTVQKLPALSPPSMRLAPVICIDFECPHVSCRTLFPRVRSSKLINRGSQLLQGIPRACPASVLGATAPDSRCARAKRYCGSLSRAGPTPIPRARSPCASTCLLATFPPFTVSRSVSCGLLHPTSFRGGARPQHREALSI